MGKPKIETMGTTTTVVRRGDKQLSTMLGQQAVILSLESGDYFTLNQVGALIWKQLETPTSLGELERMLQEEYDLQPEQAREDLTDFLKDLHEEGLVFFEDDS